MEEQELKPRRCAEMIFNRSRAGWTDAEKLECRRLHEAYPPPQYEIECSQSDNHDPWCIVHDLWHDQIVVHIERNGKRYTVAHYDRIKRDRIALMVTAVDFAIELGEPKLFRASVR